MPLRVLRISAQRLSSSIWAEERLTISGPGICASSARGIAVSISKSEHFSLCCVRGVFAGRDLPRELRRAFLYAHAE
jgi:hypothetical protein